MWLLLSLCAIFGTLLLKPTQADPKEDFVTSLPGLAKMPPFKQYSGYLEGDSNGDKQLHYWFVESSSNPRTDPVVLWLTGGPGCSSNLGYIQENGPFHLNPNGTLYYNPYSWNTVANVIYLESPVGVGYSYSRSGNIKANDTTVAIENAFALKSFFNKFPEYKNNDFYITGESYGGVYIPTLAAQVLGIPSIKLKGFAIGNALSSISININSMVYFAYYHGLVGDTEWNYLINNCCPENGPNRCNFSKSTTNQHCNDHLNQINDLIWNQGIDPYNLYAKCSGGVLKTSKRKPNTIGWPFFQFNGPRVRIGKRKGHLLGNPQCGAFTGVIKYFNDPAVKAALHVSPQAAKWMPCSDAVSDGYVQLFPDVKLFYEIAINHNLRLMLYNGDVDMACNFLGEEWFVDSLGLKNPGSRKMWYYRDQDDLKQVAGFVKTFDHLTLVTVKGAGHLVPQDEPVQALELFTNYIQNKPFNVGG